MLEDLGLVAALRSLVSGFRDLGDGVSSNLPDGIPEVSREAATALYRITQEALRNATKHASGAPVHVKLETQDGHLQLTIRDAGPGFDLAYARHNGGLGLFSMQERARLARGTPLLNSKSGDGTVIEVRVPLETP